VDRIRELKLNKRNIFNFQWEYDNKGKNDKVVEPRDLDKN
jgi:hypothetical protein